MSDTGQRHLIARYIYAVVNYWYAIVAGVALGWVDVFERIFGTWWIFPTWLRLAAGTLGLGAAQFLAYRDLDRQRAAKIKELETDLKASAERERKERMPPLIFNVGGGPSPIRISGSQHSAHGPFMDVWGGITVVNPTQTHMKIALIRLLIDGEEWEFQWARFHLKSDDRERYDGISMMGNEKQDYNLHFLFPEDKVPKGKEGELWMVSSNREDEPFPVPIMFC